MKDLVKVTVNWNDKHESVYYTDREKALEFVKKPFQEDWLLSDIKDATCAFANEVEVSVGGWLVQGSCIAYTNLQ